MKKTLIYIIGAGRSGTTFLDIVLGNSKNAISLGEINRFFKRSGIPPKRDEESDVYLFWEKIRLSFGNTSKEMNFDELNTLFSNNEFHSKFLKSLLKINDVNYKNTLKAFYKSILINVEESIIIESSKYPARALNISNYLDKEDFDIKFIYLKKDPIKVIKSFNKKGIEQPSKSFFMSNIYYLLVNTMCTIAIFILNLRGHETYCLKNKTLLKNPTATLQEASKALNLDFSGAQEKFLKNKPLNTGFLFDGNRIRLKETLTLQVSDKKEIKNGKYYFTRIFNYIVYR